METGHMVSGAIISRRSIGRNLAFAEVKVTAQSNDSGNSNETKHLKVKFNRRSFLGPVSVPSHDDVEHTDRYHLDALFPTKKSCLPYGAKVKLQLGNCMNNPSADISDNLCTWEVVRWKIVEHPKEIAEQVASLNISEGGLVESNASKSYTEQNIVVGNGAISCSAYLKVRREQFDMVRKGNSENISMSVNQKPQERHRATIETNTDLVSEFSHGGKQAKAKRAKVFAAWVLDTFFAIPHSAEIFCQPCSSSKETKSNDHFTKNINILDIAGGKGHLSLELILQQLSSGMQRNSQAQIATCTIIDPVVRKGDAKMRQTKLQKARKHCNDESATNATITHLATPFTIDSFQAIRQSFNDSYKIDSSKLLLLGLHPDQCTEDIVDAALSCDLSFAVVPCCVFPDLFPTRQYWIEENGTKNCEYGTNGKKITKTIPVRTYDDFLKYLMQKDEGIQMTTLPFEGKNIVLYKIAQRPTQK